MPIHPPVKPPLPPTRSHLHVHRQEFPGPGSLLRGVARNRHLIGQMTRRDVLGRYRGSYLGLLWPFLSPIFLLAIYTVVFKYILHASFDGSPHGSEPDFALKLFSGLIVFNVFAECISRAPNLIMLNTNYVNRVVFPLEILPINVVLSSLFHLTLSVVPLVVFTFVIKGYVPWTAAEWPLLLLPMLCYALGLTWLLAAVGVFLRDLNEGAVAAIAVLMYGSAIFYPVEKVPVSLQPLVRFNPLANLVAQSRQTAVIGHPLEWSVYGWLVLGGIVALWFGYMVFMRVKHTFADVI